MPSWTEWLGYVASLIVLVSLLMSSVKRLRWINLAGSLVFAVYGFLIGALPVAVMNLGIVLINTYYLYQMYVKKDYFSLLVSTDQSYFKHFLASYEKDIKHFMAYDENVFDPGYETWFILRNTVPAGVVVGKRGKDSFDVVIDYVTPQYRDFKIGKFLYVDQMPFFKEQGIKKITSRPGNEAHQAYLKKMGFEKTNQQQYAKNII